MKQCSNADSCVLQQCFGVVIRLFVNFVSNAKFAKSRKSMITEQFWDWLTEFVSPDQLHSTAMRLKVDFVVGPTIRLQNSALIGL
jgi:hypothetical protein